jgi:MFS-type transporter involved in bile tolerance (Atg22 family)
MTVRASRLAKASWALYDCGNSAFSAVIVTFVFATYCSEGIARNSVDGTADWGWAMTVSALSVAVLGPIFGAIADIGGRRKPWLVIFTLLTVLGSIFAAGVFGMPMAEVIKFGILLNITAGIGALGFAWVDDWIGARPTILIALAGLIVTDGIAISATNTTVFWIAGALLGIFVGPAQAASRSLMGRIAPAEMRAEMFGLYALSGTATAFLGPFILGTVTDWTGSQQLGMATITGFFIAGGIMLVLLRHPNLRTAEVPSQR